MMAKIITIEGRDVAAQRQAVSDENHQQHQPQMEVARQHSVNYANALGRRPSTGPDHRPTGPNDTVTTRRRLPNRKGVLRSAPISEIPATSQPDANPQERPAENSVTPESSGANERIPQDDDAGQEYQKVGRDGHRRPDKGSSKGRLYGGHGLKERGVGGTAGVSNRLTAGPETCQVQITNVNPRLGVDDIKDYIRDQDNGVDPHEIKDTSTEGRGTKRFLITLKFADMDKVMTTAFWPNKIYFKKWFPNLQVKHK